ncbi:MULTISPECIES: hypothetical protein [Clostridium]|uniref:DUF3006 domain-containing protein n=1 Tax=Clostridium cibarium TaxID=2762247 RepID=A0ABR8PRZ3_9CLOT|nr:MULTISPECIES: hypothetical protein [Clostridium]MBD7910935.1 hypothetical protein [Clostridium cibarium]
MKAIIIDKNSIDAYVSLEDGRITSIPLNQISNFNIGDTINIPNENIVCSPTAPNSSSMVVNKLIDFF